MEELTEVEALEAEMAYQRQVYVETLQRASDEMNRLRQALGQCAERFATPPGTVAQCQQAIAVEFQRRMDIAGAALATAPDTDAVAGGKG